jgi:hypothetical protein
MGVSIRGFLPGERGRLNMYLKYPGWLLGHDTNFTFWGDC